MGELPRKYVREYLSVAVRVRREPGEWRHAVFVEDAQGAEIRVAWVVVGGEGEGVVGVEPAVIGVAARAGGVEGDFGVREEGGGGFAGGHGFVVVVGLGCSGCFCVMRMSC